MAPLSMIAFPRLTVEASSALNVPLSARVMALNRTELSTADIDPVSVRNRVDALTDASAPPNVPVSDAFIETVPETTTLDVSAADRVPESVPGLLLNTLETSVALIDPVSVRDIVLNEPDVSVADNDPVSVSAIDLKTPLVSVADSDPVSFTDTALLTETDEVSVALRAPVSLPETSVCPVTKTLDASTALTEPLSATAVV